VAIRPTASGSPSTAIAFLLLVAVAVSVIAPLLDHHAAERQPKHSHLVIGLVADGVRALASHGHGYEQPHSHSPMGRSQAAPRSSDGLQVVVISGGEGASAYAGIGAESFLMPQWQALSMVVFYSAVLIWAARTLVEAIVPVPKVPPRAYFSLAPS
jgi:hypothetical protein